MGPGRLITRRERSFDANARMRNSSSREAASSFIRFRFHCRHISGLIRS